MSLIAFKYLARQRLALDVVTVLDAVIIEIWVNSTRAALLLRCLSPISLMKYRCSLLSLASELLSVNTGFVQRTYGLLTELVLSVKAVARDSLKTG